MRLRIALAVAALGLALPSVAGAAPLTPIKNTEQCMLCHGNGKVADIRTVHITFK